MALSIEVVEDPARAGSAMLVGAAANGGHLVVAGGSTPRAAYQEFAQAVRTVELDLSGTAIWFGDERCVPPDDDRSNYKMVKESLLDGLNGVTEPAAVHRMRGELEPDQAADEYERELHAAGVSQFELLLLGIGPDGHTASLFPDQRTLSEGSRLVVGVPEAGLEPFVPRITFTLPAIAIARHVVFLISGGRKADAVAAAFGKDAAPDPHVPSSMVVPLARHVTVLLDPAAAARL